MIATSNANNDGGQFELNFHDERLLPFEGAGAVDSEWVLELPDKFRTFDYDTISDVIFQVSYRAKYDGGLFKNGAISSLAVQMGTLTRLISLKQEFPDALFQLQTIPSQPVELELDKRHLPFFAKSPTSFEVSARIASSDPWGSPIAKNSNGKYPVALAPLVNEDVYVKIAYKL